ncbi:MAG: PAS domain S-box protein [Rhodospirillales bacterium]|nr:PAS domain S-box protein [Rhodospirillales bacterium]
MLIPPRPENDRQRVEALINLKVLDTKNEERFDRITRIARSHFKVPMALVSLVDVNRQWFKSCQGLDATETPRDVSFCAHAILNEKIFCIENAPDDKRFADNPLVIGPPHIRFYAGAPLSAPDGSKVGTLCILDTAPRVFAADEGVFLRDLANIVESELALTSVLELNARANAQEARLRTILETVIDGIITIDGVGTVETFNAAAERIFGFDADEVIGNNVNMLMPEPFHSAHDGYLQHYISTGTAKIIGIGREVIGLRKNKTTFPMDLAVSEMMINGERKFTGIVRDITERKNNELALVERSKELMQANTELDAFAYSVSHDLRAPLRGMSGFSQALMEDHADKLDDEAKNYLGRIHSASRRMGQMIDDILTLSRATRQNIERQEVDLSQVAEEILDELRMRHPDRKVEANVAPGMVLVGDRKLFQVVMDNLAWKFTGKREIGHIEVGIKAVDGETVYFVRDDGAGFDMAYVDKLFGIFQRLHSVTEFDGTGVGLATVARLIRRCGGRVWAEAAVDQGATLYFTVKD